MRYEVETERGLEEKVSYGSNWLQVLLLGIECVRRLIPRSEDIEMGARYIDPEVGSS